MLKTAPPIKAYQSRLTVGYYGWLCLALLILGLLGYGLTLNSFFVADDYFLLRQSQAGWSLLARADFAFYRPLTLLTWWLNFQVGHLQPWSYHAGNLLLHVINSLLVAGLVNLLATHRRYGWLAGLVFCVYPAQPEAVTWLAGRFDVLATTGELLAFIYVLKFYRGWQTGPVLKTRQHWLWLGAALFCYWLALLSKEAAVFLPLMVAAYLTLESFIGRTSPRRAIGLVVGVTTLFLLVTSLYFGLRLAVLGSFGSYNDADYNFLSFGGWATPWAYSVLVAPVNVAFLVEHKTLAFILLVVCHLLYWGSLVFLVVRLRLTKNPRVGLILLVAIAWSVLAIEPALTVPYIRTGWKSGDLEGSRVLYAAGLGVSMLLAMAIVEAVACFKNTRRARVVLVTLTAFVTIFHLGLLLTNNWPWLVAGQQGQQIEQQFSQVVSLAHASGHDLSQLEAGVGLILQGLPDNFQGAYVARNMFSYQDNLGQVFYNLHVPAAQIESGQPLPDFTALDFKTLYIIKFSTSNKQLKLETIEKLDKAQPPQTLFKAV